MKAACFPGLNTASKPPSVHRGVSGEANATVRPQIRIAHGIAWNLGSAYQAKEK
jgi:hypothetical protein